MLSAGFWNTRIVIRGSKITTILTHGLNFPPLRFALSTRIPIIGSLTASHILAIKNNAIIIFVGSITTSV